MPDPTVFQRWFDDLQRRDPRLYEELAGRLNERLTTESHVRTFTALAEESPAAAPVDLMLETIVREGRPALPVKENRIATEGVTVEAAAQEMVDRLLRAAPVLEPAIPLVGRIDVANYPNGATFLGTGWLVDRDVVVTNRHVAELIARQGDGEFVFRPGRFGEDLVVSLDYRHELGVNATATAPVRRVIWIETDAKKADFALLEVGRRGDGTMPEWIPLAEEDATPDTEVVVVGYPARAPVQIIPDQTWMDRIYGGTYDVKRIAPGLMGSASRGWSTHDCTTLGGNSGSVVLDMKTGKAVALHFAGLYMIENYAVPASTVRKYLKDRPWHFSGTLDKPAPKPAPPKETPAPPPAVQPQVVVPGNVASVSVSIPLTITVSIGQPTVTGSDAPRVDGGTPVAATIEDAARSLFRERRGQGVLAVRPGYAIERGRLTDRDCLVVAAHPDRVESVRAEMPFSYQGFPVEVRPASIQDQLAGTEGVAEEAVTSIAYNDEDRTGKGFSFDWVDEEMTAILHVGPERSWAVLSDFLAGTKKELVSSMYEFHAAHVAEAVERELSRKTELRLVLAQQSRDPKKGKIPAGDFDRSDTFDRWAEDYGDRFERIFVPIGGGGLVKKSYHIKVTVRDREAIWLSSGNWKRSSQPVIPSQSLNDPKVTSRAGNREWHVVIENETLAERFRNHILADFERSLELGGTLEATVEEILVDVPGAVLEAIELEAPAERVLEPLTIHRKVRVKPLLTPDQKGGVYSEEVLKLIRSAKSQLLFQNQYILMAGASAGFLKELVDALVERSKKIKDVRIILRTGGDSFWDDISALKQRGLDINRCVRRLSNTHTKGIIVDGRRVLVGSQNWSSLGVTLNRDASLLFDDEEAAQYYADAFDIDWKRATELTTEEAVVPEAAARLAVGDQPPPGFVRMTLSEYLEG